MAQSKKMWVLGEGAGLAALADIPLFSGFQSKDMRTMVGLVLAAVLAVGLGVLGYSLTKHREAPQSTDYVAGFENSCIPGATKNYLATGIDRGQAEARATEFCRCVATTVSDKISPDVFAEVARTKKMPNSMVLAIGTAAKTCQ